MAVGALHLDHVNLLVLPIFWGETPLLPACCGGCAGFWYSLIDEETAAAFLDLSVRSMQGYRYKGGGARYVRISSRCVKYRRIDLREWAEARMRTSTSDSGQTVA